MPMSLEGPRTRPDVPRWWRRIRAVPGVVEALPVVESEALAE